ncbi:hypothetical protein Prubr_60260 [Polymorphospora rubra]|uniref:LacI family transcriptional regulator n=1 Tax=Polymorphospora rubra TaxID=338584 RepID=A0A810NCG5_9ACTN|nr:hypothetical protein Prubr_60260 [Polymorphospora rubra]
MRITIADVAARAGVSKTTVSRVLNGRGELDDDTAARVRAVIDELGYVPSARAVGLARGRTRIVGMLVPSLIWPWMGEVVQGAVDVVESGGYGLLLFTCNQGAQSMRQFAAQVSAKSFDGLLVIEPEGTLDYITQLPGRGLPVVLIDDRGSRRVFPSVATTNRAGGAAAAGHLLELGRTRPLVVTGSRRFGCTRDRMAGFADTYAANGLPLPPNWSSRGTSPSSVAAARSSGCSPTACTSTPSSPTTTCPPAAPCGPCGRPADRCPTTSPSSGSTTCRTRCTPTRR